MRIASVERLESRTHLSGNVTAEIQDGSLIIWGDNVANDIIVDQATLTDGQIRVTSGSSATSINNQAAPVLLEGFTGDVFIGLRQGPDRLVLRDLNVPGSLMIQTGLGIDNITLFNADVQGNSDIRTGVRADSLTIDDMVFTGDVLIDMRWGADSLRIEQSGDIEGERSFFNGAVQITMERGIDDLRIGLDDDAGNIAVFYQPASFDGGEDYDELRSGNANWFDFDPVVTNFEYAEEVWIPV